MTKKELKNRIFIKGFDKDLKCKNMQFEIGKEYKINNRKDTKLELCTDTVFHFCDSLQKVHEFYSCLDENNRFCYIEVIGKFIEDDEKCGSDHIKIIRELTNEELKIAKGLTAGNTGLFNTGDRNTGDRNTGNRNTGNWNTGDSNTGNRNTGYMNTGNWNTGIWNTGDFNSCNYSNGIFCTQSPKISLFNKSTDYTMEEFKQTEWYDSLTKGVFELTKRVYYTEEEIKKDESKRNTSGRTVAIDYKEACKNWWKSLSKKDKDIIKTMPNFDNAIFEEITGIKL